MTICEIPTLISLADRVFKTLQELTEEYSPRERASNQEIEAAQHLRGRLSDPGYETSIQDFSVTWIAARVESTSPAPRHWTRQWRSRW